MKKIIIVIILSLFVSLIIFFLYFFIRFVSRFKYKDEPFDSHLSYYHYKIRDDILKKLHYKITQQFIIYKKQDYKIIYLDYPFNAWFDDETADNTLNTWNSWLKQGKRLFINYENEPSAGHASEMGDYDDEELDIEDFDFINDKDFQSVTVESAHPFLAGVHKLYINTKCSINPEESPGFFKNRKIEPILVYRHKILIAGEKRNEGEIIYLADYYLFSDKSILKEDNAVLLNNLLKDFYKEKILFDRWVPDITPEKSKSFISLSKFPELLLQVILLGIIFFLVFFKRFGLPLDKNLYNKRSILGHLEASGYFFQKTRHLSALADIFDHYFFERLQQSLKIKMITKENFMTEIQKRYNLTNEQTKIFSVNNTVKLTEIQMERELFLRKLKKG